VGDETHLLHVCCLRLFEPLEIHIICGLLRAVLMFQHFSGRSTQLLLAKRGGSGHHDGRAAMRRLAANVRYGMAVRNILDAAGDM